MPANGAYYRIRIRNEADSADLLVVSSYPDDVNPYLTGAPSGDGQSIDAITGAATTGSYSFRFADVETATATRVLTSILADAYARQRLLSLRAYGEVSEDGSTWTQLIPGYVQSVRLLSAIEGEVQIGETRRREVSRSVFKEATERFDKVTNVIGSPVYGGFAGLLEDYGGWRFKVTQIQTNPDYIQIKLQSGFDPRKGGEAFSPVNDMSQAVADYTNDWARPFFERSLYWASSNIQGWFPGLRVRLEPVVAGAPIILNPLSEPQVLTGPWYGNTDIDNLTRSGESSLWLPATDVNGTAFAPAINDLFDVWVYALKISESNPLHIYEHPVDLWEKLRLDAGYVADVDYDTTNLAALKELLNIWFTADPAVDVKLALRIANSYKLLDFDRSVIYGPFRLSTRVIDGKVQLFSIRIYGTPEPTTVIDISDLRSDEGTVFEIDESSVVTSVTVKHQQLFRWSTDEGGQPEADGLIAR